MEEVAGSLSWKVPNCNGQQAQWQHAPVEKQGAFVKVSAGLPFYRQLSRTHAALWHDQGQQHCQHLSAHAERATRPPLTPPVLLSRPLSQSRA